MKFGHVSLSLKKRKSLATSLELEFLFQITLDKDHPYTRGYFFFFFFFENSLQFDCYIIYSCGLKEEEEGGKENHIWSKCLKKKEQNEKMK